MWQQLHLCVHWEQDSYIEWCLCGKKRISEWNKCSDATRVTMMEMFAMHRRRLTPNSMSKSIIHHLWPQLMSVGDKNAIKLRWKSSRSRDRTKRQWRRQTNCSIRNANAPREYFVDLIESLVDEGAKVKYIVLWLSYTSTNDMFEPLEHIASRFLMCC